MKIFLIIAGIVLVLILLALLLLLYALAAGHFIPKNLRNTGKNTSPLFADGRAQIGAHRAGAGIAPENTPMAFDICLNSEAFEVHELEFDLHMTKDGLTEYVGGYDDYLEAVQNGGEGPSGSAEKPLSASAASSSPTA